MDITVVPSLSLNTQKEKHPVLFMWLAGPEGHGHVATHHAPPSDRPMTFHCSWPHSGIGSPAALLVQVLTSAKTEEGDYAFQPSGSAILNLATDMPPPDGVIALTQILLSSPSFKDTASNRVDKGFLTIVSVSPTCHETEAPSHALESSLSVVKADAASLGAGTTAEHLTFKLPPVDDIMESLIMPAYMRAHVNIPGCVAMAFRTTDSPTGHILSPTVAAACVHAVALRNGVSPSAFVKLVNSTNDTDVAMAVSIAVQSVCLVAHSVPYYGDYAFDDTGRVFETDRFLPILMTLSGDCEDYAALLSRVLWDWPTLYATSKDKPLRASASVLANYVPVVSTSIVTSASAASARTVGRGTQKDCLTGHSTVLAVHASAFLETSLPPGSHHDTEAIGALVRKRSATGKRWSAPPGVMHMEGTATIAPESWPPDVRLYDRTAPATTASKATEMVAKALMESPGGSDGRLLFDTLTSPYIDPGRGKVSRFFVSFCKAALPWAVRHGATRVDEWYIHDVTRTGKGGAYGMDVSAFATRRDRTVVPFTLSPASEISKDVMGAMKTCVVTSQMPMPCLLSPGGDPFDQKLPPRAFRHTHVPGDMCTGDLFSASLTAQQRLQSCLRKTETRTGQSVRVPVVVPTTHLVQTHGAVEAWEAAVATIPQTEPPTVHTDHIAAALHTTVITLHVCADP